MCECLGRGRGAKYVVSESRDSSEDTHSETETLITDSMMHVYTKLDGSFTPFYAKRMRRDWPRRAERSDAES